MKGYKKKGTISAGLAVTAFIAAALLYAILLYTEKKVTASEERTAVCTAITDIPAGTEINEMNYSIYFECRDIYTSAVPDGAVRDGLILADMTANYSITKGTVITDGMFRTSDMGRKGMKNPVLLGFKADDIFQVAGGILRSGDTVHIYIIDEAGVAELRWKDVCIEDAFDSSGNSLGVTEAGKATRFNIYLEMKDVEEFYECLDSGRIRIVKL